MAEFNYFGTATEFVKFLQSALVDGYTVNLKKQGANPILESVDTPLAVAAAVAQRQYAFLLTRDDITRYPVGFVSFLRDGVQLWAPYTSKGGPLIEVYYWAPHEKAGRRIVPCWLVAYGSRVINPATNQAEPAGKPVAQAFAALTGGLRKNASRVQSVKRTAYVSAGVAAMIADGWQLAAPFGAE